jgi:hypothetical protein
VPANLTPQYLEAEKAFRAAKSPEEKIAALEEMMATIPRHKGTDHLWRDLRRKMAELSEQAGKKAGGARSSMLIDKEGAAQVAVIGLTNSGKSQLVGTVTNATPLTGDYPFVTQAPTPGMMKFENIQIQLIDTPPLAPQIMQWWMAHLCRRADTLVIVINLGKDPIAQMTEILQHLADMRISIGVGNIDEEVVIVQKKALIVGNKLDLSGAPENLAKLKEKYGQQLPIVAISALEMNGLEEMMQKIYEVLDIIRVYTKAPGEKTDYTDPIIVPRGSTLAEAAATVHKDFASKLKYARIWGSGKHDGIAASRNHVLQDGDVIELHI